MGHEPPSRDHGSAAPRPAEAALRFERSHNLLHCLPRQPERGAQVVHLNRRATQELPEHLNEYLIFRLREGSSVNPRRGHIVNGQHGSSLHDRLAHLCALQRGVDHRAKMSRQTLIAGLAADLDKHGTAGEKYLVKWG
jgi:hypothetical protein